MASTEELKAELVGRVRNAAGRFADNVADGPLRELLFGEDPSALPQQMTIPASLLPGPIDGSLARPGSPIPAAFEEILDLTLASDTLRPESVLAMINTRGLFQIGHEKVDRAVKLIRDARHRFPSGLAGS